MVAATRKLEASGISGMVEASVMVRIAEDEASEKDGAIRMVEARRMLEASRMVGASKNGWS
jgi:hypothetical protein